MYLDTAASTIVSDKIVENITDLIKIYGNPSSQHKEGFKARKIINNTKNNISKIINCNPSEIYFTSGATMGNNIVIQGFLRKYPNGKILYSAIEHNDIILMAEYFGNDIFIKIPVDKYGHVDIFELDKYLNKYIKFPTLVVIQGANSEIGTVQDIKFLSQIIHGYSNAYFYSDLTQYFPYYKCDIQDLGVDAFSMSGQKINCIKGIGFTYVSNELSISPIIFGEQGLIGGTENVLGIACLNIAINNISYDIEDLRKKRDYFITKLNKQLVGDPKKRLPNNISVIIKNQYSDDFIELLNEFNVYASAGSACSSGNPNPSHVLLSIGCTEEQANSCVRFTIDKSITYENIDNLVNLINTLSNM